MKLLTLAMLCWVTPVLAAVFTIKGDKVSFPQSEFTVSDFVLEYGRYKDVNIIFSDGFKDAKTTLLGTKEIDVKHLESYLSHVLQENGYFKVSLVGSRTLNILPARDVRYRTMPTYTDPKQIPDSYDYVVYMHQLKHVEAANIARNMRPLIGRYGRIIDHTADGIVIADSAKNIKRVIEIMKALDTPQGGKDIAEMKKLNEKYKQVSTKSTSILDILGNNNVIFILLFCIIGGIIGFGARGYMMKRIEGGW